MRSVFSVAALLVAFSTSWVAAADFSKDVWPIFRARCVKCHGPKRTEGGLRFTRASDLLKRSDSGEPVLIPNKPLASELISRVKATDASRMPPEGSPLSKKEIQVLSDWIEAGANWPTEFIHTGEHWAYKTPQRRATPQLDSDWVHNPIDGFVLDRMRQASLAPSPSASRELLIRRVYLDLIGIPPNPTQVRAFVDDKSPLAFQRVVDQLLASPQYGEKWARPWLDLARYADSNGFQADQFRKVWAYRDWVINAINQGMPFDQFTVEQLAGDLIPNASIDQRIATGFHRCTTCNVEAGVDPEENRVNQVVDRVNTTGTVWLGTTLECAQCHDHKYDPFTQKDYYQIFAFFNQNPLEVKLSSGVTYDFFGPTMDLPLLPEQQRQLDRLRAEVAQITKKIRQRETELVATRLQWEATFRASLANRPQWHVLKIEEFRSLGGASHTVLADGSVLVSGKNPQTDTYVVTARTELTNITGFRVEALLDETLPGKGPGRQTQGNRANAILTEFSVAACECEDDTDPAKTKVIALHSAKADVEDAKYSAAKAIDGDNGTGWSFHMAIHKPHHWQALTTEPVGFESGTRLVITLDHQLGLQRSFGRFRLSVMTGDPSAATAPGEILAVIDLPPKKRTKKQQKRLYEFRRSIDGRWSQLKSQKEKATRQINLLKPETTLVMVEADKTRLTNVMLRGEFLNKGEAVEAGVPALLHPISDELPRNRLGFAKWLTAPSNPLTARVTVNRWWATIFGRGIVASVEDFGSQGEPPTHPDLLDWLAVELVESGWSMKHIHRLMVTSNTYQQSSRFTEEALEVDPDNRWLARATRFRLPAESIRDNALAASGLLAHKMAGPPVYPPQPPNIWRHVGRNAPKYITSQGVDRYRRGLYTIWRRSAPYPSFVNFDAPDRGSCVVKRSRTNTPLQALNLLNDAAYVEIGFGLAERALNEVRSADASSRIKYMFQCCLVRAPNDRELSFLVDVYREELDQFEQAPARVTALLSNWRRSEDFDRIELAALFRVAEVLLNLDEMITRN